MTEAQEPMAMVLTSCPFCGGAGRIKTITFGYSSLHNGKEGYRGECSKCGVSFHEYWLERVDAIAEWNRRAALASPPAQGAEWQPRVERNQPGHYDSGGRIVVPFDNDDQMRAIIAALNQPEPTTGGKS